MFDWRLIERKDREIAKLYIGGGLRQPDYSFFPPNQEYQFRWYISPRERDPYLPAVFLHVMLGDDPTDVMHDHDWHNTTHVLAGAAVEHYKEVAGWPGKRLLKPGVVVYRDATEMHRIELAGSPYLMTLFAIGPKIRDNQRWRFR